MNVRELRDWLKQFDPETIVEVVMHSSGSGYYDQGGNATVKVFEPKEDDTYELKDFTYLRPLDNDPHGYNEWRGKRFIQLGGYNG